jgi:two-component system nitrogen regulation response regulator NtrX
MARFILVYSHPELGERRFDLAREKTYRIGSTDENDIVLPQNDVSRHHAILQVRDADFHITDLDSKNGTFVNGQRTAAADFQCGDLVSLSSARMVIVEAGSGVFTAESELEPDPSDPKIGEISEDTQVYTGVASAEDMVALLVTTSSAVRTGAVGEPLNWAVERFALEGAAVLYRDAEDNVAMVTSAGDLGPLVTSSDTLTRLAREQKRHRAGTRIQQVNELGQSLLVAPMQRNHVLVVRFAGQPPSIGDIRAVIAAVEAVLCSGNPPGLTPRAAVERRDPEVRRFGSPLQRIAGLSHSINECKRQAVELASSDEPLFITGEAGTGKSLFARVIHDLSPRSDAPFVVVDCRRGQGEDAEAALFGDAARGERAAAFVEAEGGTLHLRGVCGLTLDAQSRLLKEIWDTSREEPGVRIISDCSTDLETAVKDDNLRQELLYALGVLRLHLPALRDRSEDIPLLVTGFQREGGSQRGSSTGGFTVGAFEALATYDWPGNVRELRSEILRLMTCATTDALVEVYDLAPQIREGLAARSVPPLDLAALSNRPLDDGRAEFERWRILRALRDCDGNQSRAAAMLGLSRAGLFKKMRRLKLNASLGDD